MSTVQDLLTAKLRPTKFEQLILPDRIKKELNNGDIQQHALLYGTPGTGKTSAAKVLAIKAMGHADYYINCSDETGIDTVREKITMMCNSVSVFDGARSVKVIILDEIDGVSDGFNKALRATIEKFEKTCRFVATCNYVNKVPEAITSRLRPICFDPIDKEEEHEIKQLWAGRVGLIMDKLGISHDKSAMDEFVRRNFPDMRRALNKIQGWHVQGVASVTADNIRKLSWDFQDLYQMLVNNPDPYKNYTFVMSNYATKVEDVMNAMGSDFVDWLVENHPEKSKFIPIVLVTVADYQAKRHLVIDPCVSLVALIFTIQKALNS
jgi:replication factor C small subunit